MAERLVAEGHDVSFVGTPGGLEARLVPEAGIAFHTVPSRGFDRANPLTLIVAAFVTAWSLVAAARLLGRVRPDVVVGFGGYVSLPLGLAASLRRVPLVLHEQNSVPGLANRILSRWAHAVGTTYEGSAVHLAEPGRAVLTGNPVRASVLEADRDRGRTMFGVDPTETLLLVFGGSRGARHINEAMVSLVPQLVAVPSLRVVHVAGRIEGADVRARIAGATGGQEDRYHVVDYIDAMGDALAAADVVVARAGATSIAEITAVGRAAVLVPYPYATDDHQTLNARTLAEAGAADLVADADLDGPALGEAVLRLIAEPERVARMARASAALAARDATERLVRLVGEAARNGKEMR